MDLFRQFIKLNISASTCFEKLFTFNSDDQILLSELLNNISGEISIADVGGGKKPAKEKIGVTIDSSTKYDGFDISLEELEIGREHYSEVYWLDLTKEDVTPPNLYDLVICLNTLEHVKDVNTAIKNLAGMVKSGGCLYLKLPSRYAVFAQLNLLLPNDFKNRIMHRVFPHKSGDGFPAYYDKSTPDSIVGICQKNGLDVVDKNLVKWTSYFSFFFPLYVLWRLVTLVQNLVIADYCESFELTLTKK